MLILESLNLSHSLIIIAQDCKYLYQLKKSIEKSKIKNASKKDISNDCHCV